jgi:glycerol-3-phosphate dehydrogenase
MILSPGHPYIAAEVVYAARHEWALHATDVIARRTRLAFLNKAAAVQAAPGVVNLMAKELGWSAETKQAELMLTMKYLEHFGGADVVEAKT